MKLTSAQLIRLQTCCSQMASSVIGFDNSRASRIAWANATLQLETERQIASFSDLNGHQARVLIDAAQGELGHRAALKRGEVAKLSAEAAHRRGVDGRRDDTLYANQPEIVSADDIETIVSYYQRLGMDKGRFDAWLRSRSSPLKHGSIRTTKEANRVRWALKGMLQNAGLWADWSKAA